MMPKTMGVRAGLLAWAMLSGAVLAQGGPGVAVSVARPAAAAPSNRANIAVVLRPMIASTLTAFPRTIRVPGATVNPVTPHVTAQDLYYSGEVPAEFFQPSSPEQREQTAGFGLNLHLPGVRSVLSMGGGSVAITSTSMRSMARNAGIAEARLEIASMDGRFTLRVQGRAVCARSQTFVTPLFSTENWLVTEKPSFTATYHF